MLKFVLRKMLNNKWMTVSILIGNIFLCSVTAALPIYSDAVMNNVLDEQLSDIQSEDGLYPGLVSVSANVRRPQSYSLLTDIEGRIQEFTDGIGAGQSSTVIVKTSEKYDITNADGREAAEYLRKLNLQASTSQDEHISIVSGSLYSDQITGGVIEAIVNEKTMAEQDLIIGDILNVDGLIGPNDETYQLKIVGVYKSDEDSAYWAEDPKSFSDIALISEDVFSNIYCDNQGASRFFTQTWNIFIDYTLFNTDSVSGYLEEIDSFHSVMTNIFNVSSCNTAFANVFQEHVILKAQLSVILWILLVPIFLMLSFYIFMVSRQTLEQEKNTVATLESRGVGRSQIIRLYSLQSFAIAISAGVIGLPAGILICRVFGSSNGFLDFVRRSSLEISVGPKVYLCVLCAVVVSALTMIIPAVLYSRVTIVGHKQSKVRTGPRPVITRLITAVGLLLVSLYGRYSFNNQVQQIISSDSSKTIDPLLLLSSSLFIISAGIIIATVIPILVTAVFNVFKKRWPPSLYTSFLRVTRSGGDQAFIMIFLVLTIAIGIYNAETARTINQNTEDNIEYSDGADFSLMETWNSNANVADVDMILYQEPDYKKFEEFDTSNDSLSITKVLYRNGYNIGSFQDFSVMGINTVEFAKIASMRDNLLPVHWYNYLNALSSNSTAVLLSMNFHDELEYQLGDSIVIQNENGVFFSGTIYGFFDYWPTYYSTEYVVNDDGKTQIDNEYLVVANLSQLQAVWGIEPYEIWISANDSSAVYNFIDDNSLALTKFTDTSADITSAKNDPLLQGINGVMTVGFIIVLMVCMTGFLIYWILSIRSRVLQFGIFRAMGMSMKSVFAMLINEQLMVSVLSIAGGVLVGVFASQLFVPLVQLSYTSSDITLPLRIVSEASDYIRLFSVVLFMLVLCIFVLIWLVKKIKIAQALKLGED